MNNRVSLMLLAAFAAFPAHAQVAVDPAGSSPLLAALNWVQGTLLGNLATTAAVIAVAVIGYLMLVGRFDWRRGVYEFEVERLAIDLLLGRADLRPMIEGGASIADMEAAWRSELEAFRTLRTRFLRYPD